MTTIIPDITDQLGKYWEQPDKSEILVDDEKAVMSLASQEKLGEYNCSLPTGTYVGKMWKKRRLKFFNAYKLCWYDEIVGDEITIKYRPIFIGRVK